MKISPRLVLIVISSVFLILSFPGFNIEPLVWIGLAPLFFAVADTRPSKAFKSGYLAGVIFFLGTVYWLIHVTLPGMLAVVLYLAIYFGLFALLSNYFLNKLESHYALIAIPSGWVALEWIRSNFMTGFGWNLLAHSQSFSLPVIQIADITGVYGVSFLIVLVNVAIFLTVKEVREKNYSFTCLMLATLLVFLSLGYGVFRLKNIFTGDKLRVAVVQGNIPQNKKWDANFRGDIISKYERLTATVSAEKPDLILWPETSVPGFLEDEKDLFDRVSGSARGAKVPLLVGTVREVNKNGRPEYYNSAVLFSGDGRIVDRYDKIHLVPFGEYIPLKGLLSFVEKFAPIPIGDCAHGTEYKIFSFFIKRSSRAENVSIRLIKNVQFSCLICFEDIFPDLTRQFIRKGANFLVNITNDAWYKKTDAAYQHVQGSIFRAVENRVNVVRAANTGLSCFIDQKGHITDRVEAGGEDLFVDGFKVGEIVLNETRTFYTMYGDLFAYLCIIAAFAYLLIGKRKT